MFRIPPAFAILLLLAGNPAWAGEEGIRVQWSGGQLSVSTEGAPLDEVLSRVAEATGLWLDLRNSFPEPVRVSFQGLSLREGVGEILAAAKVSYAIVDYQDPATGEWAIALSVGRPGAGGTVMPSEALSGTELEIAPRRPRPGYRQPSVENPPASGSPPPASAPPPTSTPSGDPIAPESPGPAPRR